MTIPATVLLVEDDESLLQGIADLLELADTGYQMRVLKAVNGQRGLEVMSQSSPDLIISDIMMPKMDGFEFLAQVRQTGRWVHIPFIFLTAKGDKKDIYAGQLTGAELYITKPFNNQELLDLVKTQLDRTFQLQTLHRTRLDKLKRDVLQLLNHEFRTPLTYVTAYYEMLADSLLMEDSANLQDYLRGIQVGCMRLTRLVEDLISLVDLRTGEARTVYAKRARPLPNVGEMLHDAGMFRHNEAQEKGIEIRFEIEPNLPTVYGSPVFLLEIFDRLIDNAIKFTHSRKRNDGWVALRAWPRNGELCLAVADNGVGFPPHARRQIFDLFSQYNRDQMEQQGSGSGLAIVHGLVELHHGRIEVMSREGVGSQFTVVLPAYDSDHGLAKSDTPPPRRATILLVEDDRFLLEGLRELLEIGEERYTFRALPAVNGQEALEMLQQHQPDLIISDIMMPVMDGYELLSRVRQNPAWLHIPFIFLSAKGERQDIHYGRRQGAEQYITKPYDSDELLKMVTTQLDRHFQVQGVMNQGFEELKRSILTLLQPDFKMPLDSVTDYSQQIAISLQTAQTDADLRDSLQGLQTASSRLSRLVEDFITLAELKTGETRASYQMRAAPVSADALLYEISYADWSSRGELIVYSKPEGDSPLVYGDERALSQLLRRLVETAFFLHSKSTGQAVRLIRSVAGEELRLSVGLEGAAFTAEEAAQVENLFANDDQTALQAIGYGPNLTIAKGIAELHDGRLQLENEPGQSCKFTLCLPIYTPENS
jgi:two-component system, sensor histidine kinase and response regulator